MTKLELWGRYKKYLSSVPECGLLLDISRMNFTDDYFDRMESKIQKAFRGMGALESGAIANPDERRRVGHYWLRAHELAPTPEIRRSIKATIRSIKEFSTRVHKGSILAPKRRVFSKALVIGIGGSALGPQFVSHALRTSRDPMKLHFFDNTDPDGMDLVLRDIGENLSRTLPIVISKSGGTKETRNGMIEAKAAYQAKGLDFG